MLGTLLVLMERRRGLETGINIPLKDEGTAAHGHPDAKEDSLGSHLRLSDSQGGLGQEEEMAPTGVNPGRLQKESSEPGLRVAGTHQGCAEGSWEDVHNKPRRPRWIH